MHTVKIIEGTTPTGGGRLEYRVVCDKCGLLDKSGDREGANMVKRLHTDHPHKFYPYGK